MSRLFDEMPEELKMLLGLTSPTDLNKQEKKDDFDWDNPPVKTDKFPTLVPEEAITKLVEVRKLLCEVKDLVPNAPELAHKENLNAYSRLHAVFVADEIQTALVQVNTLLHTHTDEMTKQVVEAVDEFCTEEKTVPTKAVTKMIRRFMIHSVLGDILK